MKNPIPFRERDTTWKKNVDLFSGKWPGFVFGLGTQNLLPVFRFSRVTRQELEPYLIYLMQNGYQTLQSAEVEAVLSGDRPLEGREVVLCFDHAWASLWSIASPLLERYDQKAITFAIPGRTQDREALRPSWGQLGHDPALDYTENPFCSWQELKALSDHGRLDVQSNGWSHGKIFTNEQFLKLIDTESRLPALSWPMVNDSGAPLHFLSRSNIFHPLLPTRSRLSDGKRHIVDPLVVEAIHDDPDAAPYLFKKYFLQIETDNERAEAIEFELRHSREVLEERLGKPIHQIAFPWGVCGNIAENLLASLGYRSSFAERMSSGYSVKPAQKPFSLGRLDYPYIRALPGRPRKRYWRIKAKDSMPAFS
jgi:peptidoglycan/xylan/chitin deacetylase (PgdA/CDA1 family)